MENLFVFTIIAAIAFNGAAGQRNLPISSQDSSYWMRSGQAQLQRILSLKNIERRAKNVIIFIGDGMGMSTITPGRIFKGQRHDAYGEEYQLEFEKFPNTGFSKTYNIDKQVPDSAGTATAMFSGVKARYRMIGLAANATYNMCDKYTNQKSILTTIADWAQASGLDTGFVTTTRVTHATPGALYAHTNNRDWECDSSIPSQHRECVKDIARQLIEDAPGNQFKVIMGGGSQALGYTSLKKDVDFCERKDGKNLIKVWERNNPKGKVVRNMQDLMAVDVYNTTKILGLFAPGHLPYSAVKGPEVPSISNMTLQAIRMLKKNKNGFVLLVEGGKIDLAHHQNHAQLALRELADMDDAVAVAMQNVRLEETLIIVTADHSHAFTMNGYPERGNDILGFATATGNKDPYETLTYANGPGYIYHRQNNSRNVNDTWRSVVDDPNRNDPFYRHFSPRYLKDDTHGGEDVGVFATGPYAHLFRGTFEQNYIAHVIAYAACFKDWPSHCDNAYHRYYYEVDSPVMNAAVTAGPVMFVMFLILLIHKFF